MTIESWGAEALPRYGSKQEIRCLTVESIGKTREMQYLHTVRDVVSVLEHR